MRVSLVWHAIGTVLCVACLPVPSLAQPGSVESEAKSVAPTRGDVIRVLAEEKTLGEAAVSLLNQYAKDKPPVYAKGIVLYAEAKAKFDGLIEQLKADLLDGRRPDQSTPFQQALQGASEKRKALFDYVVQKVVPPATGTKGIQERLVAAASLIPGADAVTLWREFRDGKNAHREEIRRQLDAQKWLPFERLTSGT
jgi:hypothetical protein